MELIENNNTEPKTMDLTVAVDDGWQKLPAKKQMTATNRSKLVTEVKSIIEEGYSQRSAIELLILRITLNDSVTAELYSMAMKLGKGKSPSYSTINRWVNDFNKHGLVGLAPGHKGSAKKDYGWEVRAMHLYALPSKPSISAVARKLTREGFDDVSDDRVRRFINSLPADKGEMSRGRLGPRLYNNTQKSFKRRTTENLPVGACYMGDGHTLDVYLQHPNGKKPWRAELTLWLDVTSRYVVGWYLSEAESAHSTLFALSYAILLHDHVPALLYIDNGSGYKNKMLGGESVGFYDRFGLEILYSLPYNAKAKGQVERFFGTMERDLNKWYPSYCGADMADEALQDLLKKHKKGEVNLPSAEQWMHDFAQWLEQYHNTTHEGLNGKTPAEVWQQLDRHPVEVKSAAIFWPRVERTVKRQAITLNKREYMAPELVQYNNKKLTIEYNLHNDSAVRVLDDKGRWICDAKLISKQEFLPASRIEEAKQKRLTASIKRLEVHAQEKRDRAGLSITHDQILDDVEELTHQCDSTLLEKTTGTEVPVGINTTLPSDDDIDILDLNYLNDGDYNK